MKQKNAREQFGREAEKYLTSPSHANEVELARCVEAVGPKGGPVLDVATGAGHTAYAFAPYASKVVALDVTPEMLSIVEREARARGFSNIETVEAPAEELPFPAAEFEGVTCRVAPHHFHDVRAFLQEANRVTIPGGWLLLVDTVGVDDPKADEQLDKIEFQRDSSHVRNYTSTRWLEMVAYCGYKIEFHETYARPHNLVNWMDRMSVAEPVRSRITDSIMNSTDWLRDYLRPHGQGEDATFHLHQIMLVGRKP